MPYEMPSGKVLPIGTFPSEYMLGPVDSLKCKVALFHYSCKYYRILIYRILITNKKRLNQTLLHTLLITKIV